MKKMNINCGASLALFFPGVALLILSVFLIITNGTTLIGLIIFPFSVITIISLKGVEIDFVNKTVKHYWNFIFFKFGNTQEVNRFNRVELFLNKTTQTLNYRSVSTTSKVQSYHVSLTNAAKGSLEIKEFVDYKKAKELLSILGDNLNFEIINRRELIEAQRRKRVYG